MPLPEGLLSNCSCTSSVSRGGRGAGLRKSPFQFSTSLSDPHLTCQVILILWNFGCNRKLRADERKQIYRKQQIQIRVRTDHSARPPCQEQTVSGNRADSLMPAACESLSSCRPEKYDFLHERTFPDRNMLELVMNSTLYFAQSFLGCLSLYFFKFKFLSPGL